jgi:hypothetical protein
VYHPKNPNSVGEGNVPGFIDGIKSIITLCPVGVPAAAIAVFESGPPYPSSNIAYALRDVVA